MPARPDRYEAAAVPNGSCWPVAAPLVAEVIMLSLRSAGGWVPVPIAAVRVAGWCPEPDAVKPATMPAAMVRQAPSTESTVRIGGLDLEAACLPLTPGTDVLTTIRSRALPVALPGGPTRD